MSGSCRWCRTARRPERLSRLALALALGLAACGQPPAPVTLSGGGGNDAGTPPPPPDVPAIKLAGKAPPRPGLKPAPPVAEPAVAAVGEPEGAGDGLMARIEEFLLDEESAPEPPPLKPETVATETGTVDVIVVGAGDTVYGLARRLGVTQRALIEANGLEAPYDILVGQRLTVPGSESAAAAEAAGPEAAAAALPEPVTSAIVEPEARGELRFAWPVEGEVISGFGPKDDGLHNDGVNIAAPAGEPVRAAEDGVVAYAGDELGGYGNLVLLRHSGGWVTAYAHNARNLVSRGQTVLRGDIIASVGASGGVSRPQSHFELRKGAEAVDPLPYLD